MEKDVIIRTETNQEMDAFVTTSGEKLLISTRQHWFALALPLIITFLLEIFFTVLSFLFFFIIINSPLLLFYSIFLISIINLNIIVKNIVDWYFHMYIVTTRKILDASYAPVFSHSVNEVILDQVRCTEIDVQINGILNEIIDMGNVIITFDRPTHKEAFVLSNIKNSKQIGIFLGDALDIMKNYQSELNNQSEMRWYKLNKKPNGFGFVEEIFPNNNAIIKGV